MIESSEEWTASLLRSAPWFLVASVVAGAASCWWVVAPPAYLLACAGVGMLWIAVVAIGAYFRTASRVAFNIVQLSVLIFGFTLVDDRLKAGGFFGFAVPCLPQGFDARAAHVQGLSVGIGVAFAVMLVFRRWFGRLGVKSSGSG